MSHQLLLADPTLLLDCRPGDGGYTETRGSVADSIDSSGNQVSNANHVLRDDHWPIDPVSGVAVRTTLLEGQRTNISPLGEPTKAQLAASTSGVTDVASALYGFSRFLRVAPSTGIAELLYISHGNLSAQAGTVYTISAFVEMLDGLGAPVLTQTGDSASDFRLFMQNTALAAPIRVERIVGNLYRISGQRTLTSLPDAEGRIDRATTNRQRDFRATGFQIEAGSFPSSYEKTTGSSVIRSADTMYLPFLHVPQEMTAYARFIEGGSAFLPTAHLWKIGLADNDTNILQVYNPNGSEYRVFGNVGGAARALTFFNRPAIGSRVEIIVWQYADGGIQASQWINGTLTDALAKTGSATLSGASYADQKLYINSRGTANQGFNAFRELMFSRGLQDIGYFRNRVAA